MCYYRVALEMRTGRRVSELACKLASLHAQSRRVDLHPQNIAQHRKGRGSRHTTAQATCVALRVVAARRVRRRLQGLARARIATVYAAGYLADRAQVTLFLCMLGLCMVGWCMVGDMEG